MSTGYFKSMMDRGILIRRVLPLLMAAVLLLVTGLLPTGQSHAKSVFKSAEIPSKYQEGYNVYHCIDISAWQGTIKKSSFQKLKSKYGITHVIVRVGYTSQLLGLRYKDKYYKANIKNAYDAGLKVGAYWYSQAKTVKEAQKEAEKTVKLLASYKKMITMPVVFDWEFGKRLNSTVAKKNGKSYNKKICDGFCNTVKKAGYEPMVYANLSTLNNYLPASLYKSWKIWVAQYYTKCQYKYPVYMWQYSSSAQFGTSLTNSKYVDINYVFVKKDATQSGQWVKYSVDGVTKYKYFINGVALTSQWLTLDGKKYYLGDDGYRLTGYQKIGNFYYGFKDNGVMYKNTTATIDGKKYKFLSNGKAVLFTAKVVNVSDGKLAYRTEASLTSGSRVGYYDIGDTISVIRVKGDWYKAGDGAGKGYWSLSQENGMVYLEKQTEYPQ